MRFKTFSFRAEWLEAAEALGDAALKAELLLAITTYGLTGEYTPSSSPVINALMVVIRAQIDSAPSRRKAIKEQQQSTPSQQPEQSEQAEQSGSSNEPNRANRSYEPDWPDGSAVATHSFRGRAPNP